MQHQRRLTPAALRTIVACGMLAQTVALGAQLGPKTIDELEGVEIEQHLGAQLPLTASFLDTPGSAVTLGDSFDGLPVILTLNYVDCPQLCSLQLAELTSAMAAMSLDLGKDYRVVTVSINPKDTPAKAAELKARYVSQYLTVSSDANVERDAGAAESGWRVLVGDKLEIDRVTETAGFGYSWVPSMGEYAHQAATILCSPTGEITRYLPGIGPEMAEELRLSLVEASEGKVGTLWDNVFLNCFIFDPNTGQYTLAAVRLLKVAAALTVLAVVTGFFFMKRREAHRAEKSPLRAGADDGGQDS